jgi:hypothetical protein
VSCAASEVTEQGFSFHYGRHRKFHHPAVFADTGCNLPVMHRLMKGNNPPAMTEPDPGTPDKKVSVIPYALVVPLLVVLAQSAWVVQGWNFRHNALLAQSDEPVVLAGMVIIALISFFVIRPFADRTTSRWTAFLGCILGFTILVESFLPKLAE